jgi:hypothetical protein
MTTVKEFNHEIWETLELLKTAKQLYLSDELYREIAIKLNNLQPPRPTCSTCNYINLECDSNTYGGFLCKNLNALNADGKVASTSGGYNIRIKDIKNFGCTRHSDYGVKDE